MNDVMKLMQSHSSVRSYTGETISEELLQEIIRSGQAAATSSFIQAYSLIRVTDHSKRELISTVAGGQPWIESAAEFFIICADMYRINHACQKAGEGELAGYAEHFLAATVDAALMAQNMMLAAESAGLGAVFIGGIRNDPQVLVESLQLPKHVYPAFGLCLGWPKLRNEVKPRMPLDMILHENTYDVTAVAGHVDAYDEQMAMYYGKRSANQRSSNWSVTTARAIQRKRREHMLPFLWQRGFLKH